jgi:ABC-type Fe3+/spermidine/putrescine transport system ATPase subunit
LLAIRPEAVSLQAEGEGVPGQIKRAAFLGQTHEYEVATPAGQIVFVAPVGTAVFAPSDKVRFRLARAIPLQGAAIPQTTP